MIDGKSVARVLRLSSDRCQDLITLFPESGNVDFWAGKGEAYKEAAALLERLEGQVTEPEEEEQKVTELEPEEVQEEMEEVQT